MFGFCIQLNILNFNQMIKQRNKEFLASKETWMQENGLDKFRTIVSEVSSLGGEPCSCACNLDIHFDNF